MTNKKSISLIVPFYNESEGINHFYQKILVLINSMPQYHFEIVCIDDGSRDNTIELLLEIAAQDSRFKIIEFSRNFGKEAAMSAGIDYVTGDAVIPIDADLQDPPELIPQMIKLWEEGFEVVLAKREDRSSDSFLKRVTAKMFYSVHNQLSSVQIPQNVGDFRLMDKMVIEALKKMPEHQRFMKGLFAWVGFKTTSIGYVRPARQQGTTKFSGWKLWNLALEGITSFSTTPLKFWTYVGALGAISTFLYAVFIVLRTLIIGVDIPGYASLLVAVIFFGSLQMLSIGILGEYIGRIYLETKNRPNYIIRRKNF
jgi:glycosyltransferase involved in cell wall biosynthesis